MGSDPGIPTQMKMTGAQTRYLRDDQIDNQVFRLPRSQVDLRSRLVVDRSDLGTAVRMVK